MLIISSYAICIVWQKYATEFRKYLASDQIELSAKKKIQIFVGKY